MNDAISASLLLFVRSIGFGGACLGRRAEDRGWFVRLPLSIYGWVRFKTTKIVAAQTELLPEKLPCRPEDKTRAPRKRPPGSRFYRWSVYYAGPL